jgi:hypothetical protein
LRGQRKETKRKAARMPLASCASRIYRGLPEGTSCPSGNVRHPCHTPNGLFPINAPMLGAAYGMDARLELGLYVAGWQRKLNISQITIDRCGSYLPNLPRYVRL